MHRRGRPATRRATAQAPAPSQDQENESVNVSSHEDLPDPTPPAAPEMGNLNFEQMAQVFAAALHPPREPGNSIERARKLGAKPYDGTGEPEQALSWLEANEEIFQVMGCTENQMVTYSAFLLRDRAKDWWKALQRRNPEGVPWALFQKEFTDKFYPQSYKDAKIDEFFKLEQGPLSVSDYEKKFSELIRVVPVIGDHEGQKINRFSAGLNPRIRTYISSTPYTQYGALVEAAVRVERSMEAIPKPRRPPPKRGWSGSYQDGPSKTAKTGGNPGWSGSQKSGQGAQSSQSSIKAPTGSKGSSDGRRSWPACKKCGKPHPGECFRASNLCFRCGQRGHYIKDCPNAASSKSENAPPTQRQPGGGQGQDRSATQFRGPSSSGPTSGTAGRGAPPRGQLERPRTQARVFVVTQQEADATPEVVTGMI